MYSKIYLDTSPIIYFLENSPLYALAMQFLEVNEDISLIAVKLRTKYVFLKPIDSIHLATAIFIGCNIFLTNDKQLKQVSEVNVELVDDL